MRKFSWVWAGLPLCLACAASPPAGGASAYGDADRAQALPRHLTVELAADGALELDGAPIAFADLVPQISAKWKTGRFAEVLLWAEVGTNHAQAERIFAAFLDAGVSHWRFAVRTAPAGAPPAGAPPAGAAPAAAPAPSPKQPTPATAPASASSEPAAPATSAPSAAAPAAVVLQTIGLHIGGGPNDEPTRQSLVSLFERQFPKLAQCAEQLSPKLTQRTTFGIDLQVGVQGGPAQAREVRTRLGPEAFRACVKETLSQVNFPAQAKPVVISYSVAFAPVSAR